MCSDEKEEALATRRERNADESDGGSSSGSKSQRGGQEEDALDGNTGEEQAALFEAQDGEAPRKKTRVVDDDE